MAGVLKDRRAAYVKRAARARARALRAIGALGL